MTQVIYNAQADVFYANARDIAAFLTVAMDSISQSRRKLTDSEKFGFCLCMAALKQNIGAMYEADGELWEMEGGNA